MNSASAADGRRAANEQRAVQMTNTARRTAAHPVLLDEIGRPVVRFGRKYYYADAQARDFTYGQIDRFVADEKNRAREEGRAAGVKEGRQIERAAGQDDPHAAGYAAGLLAAPGHQYAQLTAANKTAHAKLDEQKKEQTKTHTKLDEQKKDQTTTKLLALVVATLGLGKAAIDQVPNLVSLNYCGQKASPSDEHLCKVTGHIAIGTTIIAGASAIITLVAAIRALCSQIRQ